MTLLGVRVRRSEDPALLRGAGDYVADLIPQDAVHAVFVRSFEPHGTLLSIDVDEARAAPGVVAVLTASDLDIIRGPHANPFLNTDMGRGSLATDRVRYVGEAVAVVIAESYREAADAAELVFADIESLPAIVSLEAASSGEVLLFPEAGTNVAFAVPGASSDDFFDDCEVVVSLDFVNPRLNGAPIEPRATIAQWGDDGRLTQWSCTQFPHTARDTLAGACGVDAADVRVITPEVGGGFGAKNGSYPEDIVAALSARHLGRPVAWVETRTECQLNLAHARALQNTASIGGSRDGTITAIRAHMLQDAGAYPGTGAILPMIGQWMATGVYDIANLEFTAESVVTNTTPVGAYRGAGRPEATLIVERMVDLFAAEIGMDPAEVRRRNFIAQDAFPFTTASGQVYDSGDYEGALDKVLDALDHAGFRAEQQARRDAGATKVLGLGWSAYVEIANPLQAGEFGAVKIHPDGSALVLTGSSAHGQGHHTAFAQVASDVLGIPFDKIEVRHGDTDEVARGGGTGGSRSLQVGGTAIHRASEEVVALAKEAAAQLLEANPADIELDVETGAFHVAGTPVANVTWSEVATAAAGNGEQLNSDIDFQPPGATFPFGVHASVVEVDTETGEVRALRHIACDDAGIIVNPMIVDGQVHGGIASGIAHALFEEFRYDENATPVTTNFADYSIASAAELPMFERLEQETTTPVNPLGVKGVGEAGTIGSTPAVQNAVVDALAHLGVRHVEMPLTAERVWRTVLDARG